MIRGILLAGLLALGACGTSGSEAPRMSPADTCSQASTVIDGFDAHFLAARPPANDTTGIDHDIFALRSLRDGSGNAPIRAPLQVVSDIMVRMKSGLVANDASHFSADVASFQQAKTGLSYACDKASR